MLKYSQILESLIGELPYFSGLLFVRFHFHNSCLALAAIKNQYEHEICPGNARKPKMWSSLLG